MCVAVVEYCSSVPYTLDVERETSSGLDRRWYDTRGKTQKRKRFLCCPLWSTVPTLNILACYHFRKKKKENYCPVLSCHNDCHSHAHTAASHLYRIVSIVLYCPPRGKRTVLPRIVPVLYCTTTAPRLSHYQPVLSHCLCMTVLSLSFTVPGLSHSVQYCPHCLCTTHGTDPVLSTNVVHLYSWTKIDVKCTIPPLFYHCNVLFSVHCCTVLRIVVRCP